MPKIKIRQSDLNALIGKKVSLKELEQIFPNIKCELENEINGEIELETTHDRPDLLSSEGIARAVRSYIGIKNKDVTFAKSGLECTVDKSVQNIRPYSRMFIVRNVLLNDALIEQLMQLQEKIHVSYTSGRKNASIGVYDLDTFEFPLTYCVKSHINFTPLGEQEPMSAQEVLEKTEKGKEYAHLVTPNKYPLILDKKNLVLSMPPVLNSEDTKLTSRTKNLFVDVSGEDGRLVKKVCVLMAVALSERGKVETITMHYSDKRVESPELKQETLEVKIDYINIRLGLELNIKQAIKLLEKSGFKAKEKRDSIIAEIPCYRFDLMHPIDLVEEIAMAYGYNKIEQLMPKVYTKGESHPIEDLTEKAQDLLVGAGFQEVLTYMLTSSKLLTAYGGEYTELANPVSEEHDCMRHTLIPNLLALVSENRHYPLPHKVFEAGDIIEKTKTKRKLAAVLVDTQATFTQVKSILDEISKNLDFEYTLEQSTEKAFIPGRTGKIYSKKEEIGIIGEIHPMLLNQMEIEHPVAVLELDLEKI
ncbi:phenylalanine--tRNA ligase subunit beta [archaeon]|nr:phenylalanine--tRNA ligase subunit beta [archaeon]